MRDTRRTICRNIAIVCAVSLVAIIVWHSADALAQAKNPFNVGISEGGGSRAGIAGWILAKQIEFERGLSAAVRAVRTSTAALWTLMGLSFAYGVFHAAGPGHGKAVVASYMIANERALKRGIVISFAAAMLQACVAIAIVGALALLFNATSQKMKDVANFVELASFAGIAALGAWLVWRKGRDLLVAWRIGRPKVAAPGVTASRFACEAVETDPGHVHDENCGHFHMPDPKTLGDQFSWRDAALTVITAGSRPCSGAILVLVFALAQGILYAGVAATFAMGLGTAITTSALAATAVLFKNIALRLTGEKSRRGELVARGIEFCAAGAVLLLGVALFLGYSMAGI